MFENAVNWKKQGDIGMCYAIAYYSKLGWTISIPLTDSQDCDLVIDTGNSLLKVQVKTTTQIAPNGFSIVSLRTNGGNKSGNNNKNFDQNKSDLLFIMTDKAEFFSIPRNEITALSAITLGEKYMPFKVNIL